MNVISIICLVIVLLFTVVGFKRGVIRSLVQLVGTVSVLVISYVFKDILADFLMKYLPFFDFPGLFKGVTTMNVLFYKLISFIVIFVLCYCLLNILITISGLIEKLLKMTIVLAIPSKILGAILGLIEGLIMAYLVMFIMIHIPFTESIVMENKAAVVILERTPIMGPIAAQTTFALEEINDILKEMETNEDRESVNFSVLHILIHYEVISNDEANKLIKDKKLEFTNKIDIS